MQNDIHETDAIEASKEHLLQKSLMWHQENPAKDGELGIIGPCDFRTFMVLMYSDIAQDKLTDEQAKTFWERHPELVAPSLIIDKSHSIISDELATCLTSLSPSVAKRRVLDPRHSFQEHVEDCGFLDDRK